MYIGFYAFYITLILVRASHEFFSSGLSQSRSYYSSSSLHSKSSTLSSRKSSASVFSISTNKTPVVPRKSIKQNKPEQMVTIKESYIETGLSYLPTIFSLRFCSIFVSISFGCFPCLMSLSVTPAEWVTVFYELWISMCTSWSNLASVEFISLLEFSTFNGENTFYSKSAQKMA